MSEEHERGKEQADERELLRLLREDRGRLRVFPLPGVVVFPGTPSAFHIFEPRYREMIGEVLAGNRLLVVATLSEGASADPSRPDLLPVAGAGFIDSEERLEDGRYNIVVHGLARVQLLREVESGKQYRTFGAEILEDAYPAGGHAVLSSDVHTLEQCIIDLVSRLPAESGAPHLIEAVSRCSSPGMLADLVAAAVVTDPQVRYALLAELDVAKRLERVIHELAGVILMLSQGRVPVA